jgi:hypothetical protein
MGDTSVAGERSRGAGESTLDPGIGLRKHGPDASDVAAALVDEERDRAVDQAEVAGVEQQGGVRRADGAAQARQGEGRECLGTKFRDDLPAPQELSLLFRHSKE